MPKSFDGFFFCGADIRVDSSRGETIRLLSSARYNAAISALEMRAPRNGPPALVAAIGDSPLTVNVFGPDKTVVEHYKIHFETATLAFPFEFDDYRAPAMEVVVLRGLRIEMVEASR